MAGLTAPGLDAQADGLRALAFYRLPLPASAAGAAGAELPEWKRVRESRPRFVGHRQPQLPGELGYCDARSAGVREIQARLAQEHAISGFCYVFTAGPEAGVLDPTLAEIVSSGKPAFPFCVCWETTRSHAGAGFDLHDNRGERRFSRDECLAVIRALAPALADPRYVRLGGRPLLIVSSPDPIPEVRAVSALWREECSRAGLGDPYIACYGGALGGDPAQLGFDAIVECPPLGGFPRSRLDEAVPLGSEFAGNLKCYRSYVGQLLVAPRSDHRLFRTVMTAWDETPRGSDERLFVNANPETFGYWAERVVDQTRLRNRGDERVFFVRAWNEWEAGCHLEPDTRDGRRYLEALRGAIRRPTPPPPSRPPWREVARWAEAGGGLEAARIVHSPGPGVRASDALVSVVMPAYNHERFVVAALDSILAQTYGEVEIIVIDDGSRDGTGALLDRYAARCGSRPLTVVHQANAGAHEAINHGLALARGGTIAVMNSDDLYAPERLARLVGEMDRRGASFAFSNYRFIDDEGKPVDPANPYADQLRKTIVEAVKAPDLLYALVYSNITISTGNFVFRRELMEKLGGFCAMRVCHDWEFVLAASYETALAFVDEPLYEYRLHGTNTFSGSRVRAAVELEQVLARFFERLASHPLAAEPERLDAFTDYARRVGLGGYLPAVAKPQG